MRFCPTCGAPVELKRPAGDTLERHVCSRCGEIHYRNPKVVVGAVCTWQDPGQDPGHDPEKDPGQGQDQDPGPDRVLLCRRAIEPRRGFWAVPAGYLELGESTEQGAVRETLEEACARIEILGLLAIYNVVRIGQVQLFYRARLLSPEIAAGIETLELDLFDWSAIPWDELAFPSVDYVLRRALALRAHPGPIPVALGP